MKERYSLKRRAFGPAESQIRAIVNSCTERACKFNVVSHSKQRNYGGRVGFTNATDLNDIADLSASSVQDQLETVGIENVSPPKNTFGSIGEISKGLFTPSVCVSVIH